MSTVIKVENLSKAYQIGQIGTGTISKDLERWWTTAIRGKEDPFLKIGETNDRAVKGKSNIVWSLKDINFEIKQGDAVGIIGRNGAGKSTLLKILSEVTSPTTGKINIKGRVASLLEVGTGFHPELTGRENIFLNGAILGMRKKEIQRKLDQIIDFSGVERYVDTPVKRYSSGMYVRLAFAVAAHLESEILIVDEVLAVGDAEFQKKCLGKMGEVSRGEGRTVLFVSHNMAAVNNLCNKGIILQFGQVLDQGSTYAVIEKYINSNTEYSGLKKTADIKFSQLNANLVINSVALVGAKGVNTDFGLEESICCEIEYEIVNDATTVVPSIHLLDKYGECIFVTFNANSASIENDPLFNKILSKGIYKTSCIIPANFLNEGSYKISVFLAPSISFKEMTEAREVLSFQTHDTGEMSKDYLNTWIGLVRPKLSWNSEQVNSSI